ncbi:hypothetical protein GOP47_0018115 [Adiantum capillus-veneris]|uniref:Uncharacterized protein n=1 Tax=Adiantum capillus-veneris TaxID=13818 RepID=A0A9D4UH59_ADICA|nr:hypothetical protein GOP47_0018115 [Adiantum capillus-veneris]
MPSPAKKELGLKYLHQWHAITNKQEPGLILQVMDQLLDTPPLLYANSPNPEALPMSSFPPCWNLGMWKNMWPWYDNSKSRELRWPEMNCHHGAKGGHMFGSKPYEGYDRKENAWIKT